MLLLATFCCWLLSFVGYFLLLAYLLLLTKVSAVAGYPAVAVASYFSIKKSNVLDFRTIKL